MIPRRAIVLVSVVMIAAVACGDDGSVVGPGGSGGGGPEPSSSSGTIASATTTTGGGIDPETCGPAGGIAPSAECRACTAERCCAESAACGAEGGCEVVTSCLDGCPERDAACTSACFELALGPSPAWLELRICQGESCPAECGFSPIDCSTLPGPLPDASEACTSCFRESCCDEIEQQLGPDSMRYQQCSLGCTDHACLRQCEIDFPAGVESNSDILRCHAECEACDGACGFFTFPPACDACMDEACCERTAACALDTSCIDLLDCMFTCSGEGCRECLELWPAEQIGRFRAMDSCAGASCSSTCGGATCGRLQGLDTFDCRRCLEESCCAESTACGLDAACGGLEVCVLLCEGDAGCEAACAEATPDGVELLAPLHACRVEACADACP